MDAGAQINRRPPFGALAIVFYCAFRSDHLVVAWRHSPFDRWSWIALLIWLLPVALLGARGGDGFRLGRVNSWLLASALVASLVGTMASLNAVKYLGFALAVVSLVRWSRAHPIWFVGAMSWMPAFGYFAAKWVPAEPPAAARMVLAIRLLIACVTVVCVWKLRHRKNPPPA